MTPILEVAIGVVLLFLVVAVMVSSVTEGISGIFRIRASTLERGIATMLGTQGKKWLYGQALIKTSEPPARIGVLRWWKNRKSPGLQPATSPPSYIDAVTFATTLVGSLSTPTSETLLARILPQDEPTRQQRVTDALTDRAIRSGADREVRYVDALARYLLNELSQPNSQLTAEQVAAIVGDIGAVTAARSGLAAGDPAGPALDAILQPPPGDVTVVVKRIIGYSPELSTPSLAELFNGLAVHFPLNDLARNTLRQLAQRADGDITKFRQAVEDWFDREMDRVSGLYNRWSQVVMLLVGLAIAIGFNMSAYTVGRALWVDQTLRSNVVSAAEQVVATTTTTTTARPNSASSGANQGTVTTTTQSSPATTVTPTPTYQDLKTFGLPVGWSNTAWPTSGGDIALHVLGWLVVAVAASFGAPFWFDTLNKFVNLRTSGPPPATAADQRTAASGAP